MGSCAGIGCAALWLSPLLALVACGGAPPGATGRVRVLKYDGNRDGTIDAVGEVEGTRIVRVAVDDDQDGRPERWEYYGPDQRLEKVGFSRTNDGRENAWSFAGADGTVARVEIAGRREGQVSRIEHFEHERLVRAEEDANDDGRFDRWETYQEGRLASVTFDVDRRGTPSRRVRYRGDGTIEIDVDPGGDGHWRAAGSEPR